jgi:outer membrane receptor protein involved in Fe transport
MRDVTGDKVLNNVPEHSFKSGISTSLFEYIIISFESLYESKRITVYDTETKPYIINSMYLKFDGKRKYSLPPKTNEDVCSTILRNITIGIKIYNLFNSNYSLPGGLEHRQNSLQQYGRNFLFELSISF